MNTNGLRKLEKSIKAKPWGCAGLIWRKWVYVDLENVCRGVEGDNLNTEVEIGNDSNWGVYYSPPRPKGAL